MDLLTLTLIRNNFKSEKLRKTRGLHLAELKGMALERNHNEPKSLKGMKKGREAQMFSCCFLRLHHKSIMEFILRAHILP